MKDSTLRVMAIGAHPDDCEIHAGGAAALWAKQGHAVLFLSMTDGQSGHHKMGGPALIKRRTAEAQAAAKVAGLQSKVLPLVDGYLEPSLDNRIILIKEIRTFKPDVILTNRPNDYHPDHRYTSQLVQDSAFSLTVPHIAPGVPALKRDPVIMYWRDYFQKPVAFKPDIAIDIDSVWDTKIRMVHEHTSQMYEWIPWLEGNLEKIPEGETGRLAYLENTFLVSRDNPPVAEQYHALLAHRYGAEKAGDVVHAEAFEACEYGSAFDEVAHHRIFAGL